jgi:hypothetical protein
MYDTNFRISITFGIGGSALKLSRYFNFESCRSEPLLYMNLNSTFTDVRENGSLYKILTNYIEHSPS